MVRSSTTAPETLAQSHQTKNAKQARKHHRRHPRTRSAKRARQHDGAGRRRQHRGSKPITLEPTALGQGASASVRFRGSHFVVGATISVAGTGVDVGSSETCHGCLLIEAGPVVDSVSPARVSRGTSNVDVRVFGSSFAAGAQVKLGKGILIESSRVVSDREVDAVVSISSAAKAGARSVTVIDPDHGKGRLVKAFAVR
jgi:hypothetical protein